MFKKQKNNTLKEKKKSLQIFEMDKHRRYKKHHHRFNPLGNTEPDVVDFGGNQN